MSDAPRDPLPDSGGSLPGWVDRRVIEIPVGARRAYVAAEWTDSLVVLAAGDIDITCRFGGRRHFVRGTVMWLEGLDVETIHNASDVPVEMVAIRRRPASDSGSP